MDAEDLKRRMEREREFWVEVEPGKAGKPAKRIKFLRPRLNRAAEAVRGIEECCEYVRGWEGIVEGDLLNTGGESEVEFDRELATSLLCDHLGWAKKIATAMAQAMSARMHATESVEKKSATSST